MPKGARGEKRPADVIEAAVMVMRIATGEEGDDCGAASTPSPAQQLGRRGGAARAKKLTAEQGAQIAKKCCGKTVGEPLVA